MNLQKVQIVRHAFQLDPNKRRLFEEEFPGVKSIKEFRHLHEQVVPPVSSTLLVASPPCFTYFSA